MGVALFAALDGKQLLATPPEVLTGADVAPRDNDDRAKGVRLVSTAVPVQAETGDKRRMSVSTITRVGDSDVVRTKPFEFTTIALAASSAGKFDYPAFNPLAIFAEDGEQLTAAEPVGSLIYGANVETEASIRVSDFEFNQAMTQTNLGFSNAEAEEIVRQTAAILTDGSIQVASLHYVDPLRFGVNDPRLTGIGLAPTAKIIPQNVTVTASDDNSLPQNVFSEDLVDFSSNTKIEDALVSTGYEKAAPMAQALQTLLKTDTLKKGNAIRLGLVGNLIGEQTVIRASVYSGDNHQLTIALNDQQQYVPAQEPVDSGIMAFRKEDKPLPVVTAGRDLPSAYDAIYRGVMAQELPREIASQIVRMVAADVDFQARIKPDDKLELFYSVPEENEDGTEEILFVEAQFSGQVRTFYRFRSSDGSVDFFDESGRSAKQFLLRNPVPSGVFRSPYGMRRHPILGYSKMHWGVDWAAPRGTPIIAPGNGVVEKAGWSNGYGKQTKIRHANGYETTYSHQSAFGKGIRPGARVRQGQVIGYIGTTGLSTGPHLHYEMWVNDQRVDPLRVRLPKGKVLEGKELQEFVAERDRINELLAKDGNETEVAQVQG